MAFSKPVVANFSDLTDHQWSADHWLVTATLNFSARVDIQGVEYFLGYDHLVCMEAMRCYLWKPWGALLDWHIFVVPSKGVGQGYLWQK